MSKVITFSMVFPTYHARKGEQTFFVEKLINSVMPENYYHEGNFLSLELEHLNESIDAYLLDEFERTLRYNQEPKHHTIRAGNRFKAGEWFSPCVWSGKPYNSKQIIIAPDIQIKKVWDFEIKEGKFYIDNKFFYEQYVSAFHFDFERLALNDGLTCSDLLNWFQFPKPFKGQIICWNENINY